MDIYFALRWRKVVDQSHRGKYSFVNVLRPDYYLNHKVFLFSLKKVFLFFYMLIRYNFHI